MGIQNMKNHSFVLALCLLAACQPRVNSRGNLTPEENFSSFIVGKTTMNDVLEKCGTPSLHTDNYSWIYIGLRAEEDVLNSVKETHKFIMKIIFDQNKVLKSIEKIDSSADNHIPMDEGVTNLINENQAKAQADKVTAENRRE
jgi:outer membrane protein assembly factor BamE (lipoprotein component of BamABCDE complex)